MNPDQDGAQSAHTREPCNTVVENRSGANNTLCGAEVTRSTPDGTTPLVNADIHLMARRVMRAVPTTRSRTSRPSPAWQPSL